jgi:hypothetical protein
MEYCIEFSVQTDKDAHGIKLKTKNGTFSEQFQNPIETRVKHIPLK